MNFLYWLSIGYVCFLSWAKGGLADDLTQSVRILWSSSIILVFLIRFFPSLKRHHAPLIPFIILISFFLISFNNQEYRKLKISDLKDLDFAKRINTNGLLEQGRFAANGISLSLKTFQDDPGRGLTVFLDFKNRYSDRFGSKPSDDVWLLINQVEEKFKLPLLRFLPSVPILSDELTARCFFLFFHIFLGLIFFNLVRYEKNFFPITIGVIFVNCSLLALVGIVQKAYHVPSDNALEILGIWDAPEERYFFSTFTYKNHWSAYALFSIWLAVIWATKIYRVLQDEITRSKSFMIIILLAIPICLSIPYSGSRSGTFLMLLSLTIILSCFIFKRIRGYKKRGIGLNSSLLILLIIPAACSLALINTKSHVIEEMKRNTTSQWIDWREGNPPFRFLLWKDSLKQIRERVWFGHGLEGFKTLNPKYQSTEVRLERSKGLENAHRPYVPLVAHAHNDLLEWFCDIGLVGVFLVPLPLLIYFISTMIFSASTSLHYMLMASGSMLVYSVFDFPTRTPACMALFALCIGVSMGYYRAGKKLNV